MDTALIYQDLEALAWGFHNLLLQEESRRAMMYQVLNMENLRQASAIEWKAWGLVHSRVVIFEYACVVLAQQTGRDTSPSSLIEAFSSFTVIPTPLPPASVECVSAVVDKAKCILALLYHSVPTFRGMWTDLLLSLDKFWLDVQPTANFEHSSAASVTGNTVFSDLLNRDSDNAINLLLRQPKIVSTAGQIQRSINASAFNIYIDAGLFRKPPGSFKFEPVDDIYNSVIIASEDMPSGTRHEKMSPSGEYTGQKVDDQGCV